MELWKIVILGIICVLASIGGTLILIKFVSAWCAAESEAKQRGKQIEYYMLMVAFFAFVVSILSIGFGFYNQNQISNLTNKLEKLITSSNSSAASQ